jgi:hypothetical protein
MKSRAGIAERASRPGWPFGKEVFSEEVLDRGIAGIEKARG